MLPGPDRDVRPEGMIWGLQRRLMLLLLLPLGLVGLVSFWLHYQSAGTAALQQDRGVQRPGREEDPGRAHREPGQLDPARGVDHVPGDAHGPPTLEQHAVHLAAGEHLRPVLQRDRQDAAVHRLLRPVASP